MPPKPKVKTAADYRAAHDVDVIIPNKIRAGLAAIKKEGAQNWEYEQDFLRRIVVSVTQLAAYRDGFKEHIVEAPATHGRNVKRCYFGDAKVAATLRGE